MYLKVKYEYKTQSVISVYKTVTSAGTQDSGLFFWKILIKIYNSNEIKTSSDTEQHSYSRIKQL